MKHKRRTHSPEFKCKVALAVVKGDLTMAELVKKFKVHASQVTEWKKQLSTTIRLKCLSSLISAFARA